jgi:hypothetical protein
MMSLEKSEWSFIFIRMKFRFAFIFTLIFFVSCKEERCEYFAWCPAHKMANNTPLILNGHKIGYVENLILTSGDSQLVMFRITENDLRFSKHADFMAEKSGLLSYQITVDNVQKDTAWIKNGDTIFILEESFFNKLIPEIDLLQDGINTLKNNLDSTANEIKNTAKYLDTVAKRTDTVMRKTKKVLSPVK